MMRDIAIVGAGGFGRETALMIRQMNQVKPDWNVIGFFDDGIQKGSEVDGIKILGGLSEVNDIREKLSLALAIAEPQIRKNIVSRIKNNNIDFPVLKHPTSLLGDEITNRFGRGTIITAGNILTTHIQLGEFVIVNLASTIGHDVHIGSFATIMPGCSISGKVMIGEVTMIGSGARILPNITIGDACKVGAGAVIIKNSGSNVTLVGVPAREV
jgi:sugar O-acyltransferase (sialic acid O-acetyltransferase NeuD family)